MGLTITEIDVATVAVRLSGAAGPSGTDSVDLCNWLLRFGTASERLCQEQAYFTKWLANSSPSWAAYRALMAARLVALDKRPGVRPLGIGEIYRRLMAKCVLHTVGHQATEACGNLNLCAGLRAGMEGALHAVNFEWIKQSNVGTGPSDGPSVTVAEDLPPSQDTAATSPTHPSSFPEDGDATTMDDATPSNISESDDSNSATPHAVLLVDARNGFNELGRRAMLWTVRHLWAAGARFSFNCYRHFSQLILRRRGEPCSILLSQEGVTQGDPLSMVLYGLALTPLAKDL